MIEQSLDFRGTLSAKRIHVDGFIEDLGVISGRKADLIVAADPTRRTPWYERLWRHLRATGKIPATLTLSAFVAYELYNHLPHDLSTMPGLLGLVTASGAGYLASNYFATSVLNFHDFGTGGAHGSTISISAANVVNGALQLTFASAHGATTNDLWAISGVTGTGVSSPSNWQVTVISSTVLQLVGLAASGTYTVSSATGQLINGAADTALTTPAGTARVAGAQSNPSSGVYQSVATVTFNSSLAIVEWGLFSASTSGTLWDRRWLNNGNSPSTTATGPLTASPINVTSGMGVQMTYSLSVSAGGN